MLGWERDKFDTGALKKGNCGEMASRYCLLGRSPYLALLRQSYASPVKPAGTTNLIRFNIFNTI